MNREQELKEQIKKLKKELEYEKLKQPIEKEIHDNIEKLKQVLKHMNPEVMYNPTFGFLKITERVLLNRSDDTLYKTQCANLGEINTLLKEFCENPKQLENRFKLLELLTEQNYDPTILNDVIIAAPHTRPQYQNRYVHHHLRASIYESPDNKVDIRINIVNQFTNYSEHINTIDIDGVKFSTNRYIETHDEENTADIIENYDCQLSNVPISEIHNEITRVQQIVLKNSKIIPIGKLLSENN